MVEKTALEKAVKGADPEVPSVEAPALEASALEEPALDVPALDVPALDIPALDIEVQWQIQQREGCPSTGQIQQWVALAIASEDAAEPTPVSDIESSEPVLTVRIVNSDEMRSANQQWRGIDKSTNVLSFPSDFPIETGLSYFGDMLICADVLAHESVAQGKAGDAHWAHIVIHGTLHLLGYDHVDSADAELMERREIEILATLGLDNPYLTVGEAEIPLSEVSKS